MHFVFTSLKSDCTSIKYFPIHSENYLYMYTVNNYMQVTGIATGENFAFFIYRHFVEIL